MIKFGVVVCAASLTPHGCGDLRWRRSLESFIEIYAKKDGFNTLARRYAINIANGRWGWRDRLTVRRSTRRRKAVTGLRQDLARG